MKQIIYIFLCSTLILCSCSNFLDIGPIAQETETNFFETPENALYAVNACYDILGTFEGPGPDYQWLTHSYEFFFGDMLSDDSEKGSTESDFTEVQELIEWRSTADNSITVSLWIKCYDGIYRANSVLKQLQNSSLDEDFKNRLIGEATFIRGYLYFYLVRVYGGVPVFTEPVSTEDFGIIDRASFHETYEQVIADFTTAASLLPERSGYDVSELGRATKGAANGFLSRAMLYQIGLDAECTYTWSDLKSVTSTIIESGEYALVSNYASIFEMEGENNSESIFELQFEEGTTANAPEKTGSNYSQFQGNRKDWGWGFNNPTTSLYDAFSDDDPRLSCTFYGESVNGGIVHGVASEYDLGQQMTPYLNRKAALEPAYRPSIGKSSSFNIRKMRYAEIILTHAEACYYTSDENGAKTMLEMIRSRARTSTFAKGYTEGDDGYTATGFSDNLPEITASGNELLEAIQQERRLELGLESLRFWDLVRTGQYLDMLDVKKSTFKTSDDAEFRYENVDLRANCTAKCIDGPNGIKVPLMAIPLTEVQDWGLEQNIGYN